MDKYFKNEKAMTAENLLKMYEKKPWSSMHPDLQPEISAFRELL